MSPPLSPSPVSYASGMSLTLDRYPSITYDAHPDHPQDLDELRLLRKWEAAIGYRIFAALQWGQLGDGHITARDPVRTDHFWVLGYGIPFREATVDSLILVGPRGEVIDGVGEGGVNFAAYNIHHPVLSSRPELVSAAHTHTPYGTSWSATGRPFRAISQESCSFVFDQSLYEGEDLEVTDTCGGERIAEAMGDTKLCILRNHGLLTGGASPAEAVGWFVAAERVAEVHVKVPDGLSISDEAAHEVASGLELPSVGWRAFQWLARDLVPDPSVVLG
jgi:ribulose-5-phosphate 4-epimerase/fuculose-1-phosphate aldolase